MFEHSRPDLRPTWRETLMLIVVLLTPLAVFLWLIW